MTFICLKSMLLLFYYFILASAELPTGQESYSSFSFVDQQCYVDWITWTMIKQGDGAVLLWTCVNSQSNVYPQTNVCRMRRGICDSFTAGLQWVTVQRGDTTLTFHWCKGAQSEQDTNFHLCRRGKCSRQNITVNIYLILNGSWICHCCSPLPLLELYPIFIETFLTKKTLSWSRPTIYLNTKSTAKPCPHAP